MTNLCYVCFYSFYVLTEFAQLKQRNVYIYKFQMGHKAAVYTRSVYKLYNDGFAKRLHVLITSNVFLKFIVFNYHNRLEDLKSSGIATSTFKAVQQMVYFEFYD